MRRLEDTIIRKYKRYLGVKFIKEPCLNAHELHILLLSKGKKKK